MMQVFYFLLLPKIILAELLGLQILFRHGDRMPSHFMYLPTDTASDRKPWPYESGELTDIGAKQLYELGERLRTEVYDFDTSDKFTTSQIYIMSGSDNRTSASAVAFSTSFFADYQAPNEAPFGVHSNYVLDKVSFAVITDNDCTKLSPIVKSSPEYKAMMSKWAPTMDYVSNKSGVPLTDFHELNRVLDNLYIRTVYNRSTPAWAHEGPLANVTNYNNLEGEAVFELFNLPSVRPTTSGYIIGKFMSELSDMSNNRTRHKIVLYSGHDSNIIAALLGLGVDIQVSEVNPHYGANLHIRLLGTPGKPETHYVEAYYSNDWHSPLQKLNINCSVSNECSVNNFIQLIEPVSTAEYVTRCRGDITSSNKRKTIALEIVIAILAILWVATLLACLHQRRSRKHEISEKQRLLDSNIQQPNYS